MQNQRLNTKVNTGTGIPAMLPGTKNNRCMQYDFISYLQSGSVSHHNQPLDLLLRECVSESRDFNKFRHLGLPVYMVLDFRNDVFSFISDNVYDYLGVPVAKVMRFPLSYWLKKKIYPNDFALLNERIFPDILRYLAALPFGNNKQYGFTFEIGLRNMKDEIESFLLKTLLYSQLPDKKPLFATVLLYPQPKKNSTAEFSTTLFVEEYTGNENSIAVYMQKPVTIATVSYLPRKNQVQLSKKEIAIIQLIARGMSSQEMASTMLMSFESVRKYRKKIYAKLDVSRKSDLIATAAQLGIFR